MMPAMFKFGEISDCATPDYAIKCINVLGPIYGDKVGSHKQGYLIIRLYDDGFEDLHKLSRKQQRPGECL